MYARSARFYDLLYGFKDYRAAANALQAIIAERRPGAENLLDVACGTGRHLEYLSQTYTVEGIDINHELLEIAGARCPGVPLHHGDMTGFDLGREFDVVTCLFGSIAYVRTAPDLRAAIAAMSRHLRPGGLLLLEPWFTPDQLWTRTITANHVDEPDLKISWMYATGEPEDGALSLDISFLVGTPTGVEHFVERHELGVFTDDAYRAALADRGLVVVHDAAGPFGRGLYIGQDDR